MLANLAGEAVAEPALQKGDHLGIIAGALAKEVQPARATDSGRWANGGELVDPIIGLGRPQPAGAQLHRSEWCGEEIAVAIPIGCGDGEGAVSLRKPLDATGKGGLAPERLHFDRLVLGEIANQIARPGEGQSCPLLLPMIAGPAKPGFGVVIEQELGAVLLREGQRSGVFRYQLLFAGELGKLSEVAQIRFGKRIINKFHC
jgi:hypothetical protein